MVTERTATSPVSLRQQSLEASKCYVVSLASLTPFVMMRSFVSVPCSALLYSVLSHSSTRDASSVGRFNLFVLHLDLTYRVQLSF